MTLPYLIALSLFTGAAGGGALAWWAQGNRVERLQLLVERYEASNRLGIQLAENEAARAADRIQSLEADLARANTQTEKVYVETIREIEVAASPTRQCLTPAVRRVLDGGAGTPAPAKGADPRIALGLAPAAAPDTGGSGASEQAVALWMTAALRQYSALRDQHRTLADVVRTLPCVTITP